MTILLPAIGFSDSLCALNRISEDVDMVTLRFNYRFGWGGGYGVPVAAKY